MKPDSPLAQSLDSTSTAPQLGEARPASPRPRRVVVACREPQLSDLVERVLRSRIPELRGEALDVRRVADGMTCMEEIEMTRPDSLILHSELDCMSPAEIVDAWTRSHPGEHLPAIVLSSAFGSDVPPGLPGVGVMNLPFDTTSLTDAVLRALPTAGGTD